jgi:16S rRNA (cytidine1402-2'-O)-methyltransferase
VNACREAGINVAAVPGPSAIIAALSVAGLPTDSFQFLGFLPAKSSARCKVYEQLQREKSTTVCYETPHRLLKSLNDLIVTLGEGRPVTVVRELTKVHEEVVQGSAADVLESFAVREKVRGEIVLLVGPATDVVVTDDWRDILRERLESIDAPPKKIVKEVAKEFSVSSDEVYRYALTLRSE